MDFNRLTIKSQEAVAAAQELARRARQPRALPRAPAARAARPGAAAHARRARRRVGADVRARRPRRGSPRSRRVAGRGSSSRGVSAAFSEVLDRAEEEMRKLEDEYVSTEHLLLALDVVPRDELLAALKEVRGSPARHLAGSRRAPTRRSRSSAAT